MRRNFFVILVVVMMLAAIGACAQQASVVSAEPQAPAVNQSPEQQAQQLTPEQGLQVLWNAAGAYKADRNEQALLQMSAETIQKALEIYRTYVPIETTIAE